MKKTTLAAQGSTGIAVLALLNTLAQANSLRYSDISSLELDMEIATMAASETLTGKIIEAELEMDDARAVWEVDIVNAANQMITVEIDGRTGENLSTSADDNASLPDASAQSLAQAIEIVKAVEQGAIVEAEFENDNRDLIWAVESLDADNQETKFRVHAETGEILI